MERVVYEEKSDVEVNREKIGPSLSSFAVRITFPSVHPASGRSRRDVGGRGKVKERLTSVETWK